MVEINTDLEMKCQKFSNYTVRLLDGVDWGVF